MRVLAFILTVMLMAVSPVQAYLNVLRPFAAIEYDATEATAIHGSSEAFDSENPILLTDGCQLAVGNHTISVLRAYAHLGADGLTQEQANDRIDTIQIWGWLDTNNNGEADAGDSTTQWTLLHDLSPSLSDGNVVGWEVSGNPPNPETSDWQGDILQGSSTISISDGERWLFVIRVIDVAGNSNLSSAAGEPEVWDNGNTSDGIGSDVSSDRYLDQDGSGRIDDDDVVWVAFVGTLRRLLNLMGVGQ